MIYKESIYNMNKNKTQATYFFKEFKKSLAYVPMVHRKNTHKVLCYLE